MARPRRTAQEVDAVKAQICSAARGIYVEQGFATLTMRSVAAELGWSPTALYRYFSDRDALLAAVRTQLFREMTEAMRAAIKAASASDVPLALYRSVIGFGRERLEDYKLMFAMRQPPPSGYPELRAARKLAFDTVVDAMARGVNAGLLTGDPRDIGHRVWLACQGLITLQAANQLTEGRDFEDLMPQVERMLFPGLLAHLRHPQEAGNDL